MGGPARCAAAEPTDTVEEDLTIKLALLLFAVLAQVVTSPILALDRDLLDFALQDQFENVHRRSDVVGTIVLLIGSDKGGSQYNRVWGSAIHDALGDHPGYGEISHLAYSDLRGVPFFLKGMIRGKFPEDPDHWVLMDWKGTLAKAYEFTPKVSNVLVFSPDGTLVHRAAGNEPEEEDVEEAVRVLRDLLDRDR